MIQPYRTLAVTRRDIAEKTTQGLVAIERNGEPDPDVLSGKNVLRSHLRLKHTIAEEE